MVLSLFTFFSSFLFIISVVSITGVFVYNSVASNDTVLMLHRIFSFISFPLYIVQYFYIIFIFNFIPCVSAFFMLCYFVCCGTGELTLWLSICSSLSGFWIHVYKLVFEVPWWLTKMKCVFR